MMEFPNIAALAAKLVAFQPDTNRPDFNFQFEPFIKSLGQKFEEAKAHLILTVKNIQHGSAKRTSRGRACEEVLDEKHISAGELYLEAVSKQNSLDLLGALELLTKAHSLEPHNVQVIAFASKQWTDHSFVPGMERKDVIQCNERAVMLAKAAQAIDSSYSLGHCAECIAKGRLAGLDRNPKRILELAKEAQQAAFRAIDCDHNDDVAHHLMGRFNYGMASLNVIVRQLIKVVFGADFRSGTMSDALNCYSIASRLRPDRIIHRVEYARALAAFGHDKEAVHELEASFSLPLEDINARQMLNDALALLKELRPEDGTARRIRHLLDVSSTRPAVGIAASSSLLGMRAIEV